MKRFGSLLDQHAEAVGSRGALGAGESEEGSVAPVHHVVGECAGSENLWRQRRQFAGEAGGGGVDDKVEGAVERIEAADADAAIEQFGEFLRAADGAVGDDEGGGLFVEQI